MITVKPLIFLNIAILKVCAFVIFFMIIPSIIIASNMESSGSICGQVIDEQKTAMFTVSILIEGTSIGTLTDLEGKYCLLNIPAGSHNLIFSFVGYEKKIFPINIETGKTLSLDVQMLPQVFMGNEIVVTAQARGQISAINQQRSAPGIINSISIEKLKELPDISAAEAIGRLPGLSVQRDGGEGQKVIIRGFEPKYNSISINGMGAPSTDLNNRSTDLNFVSADIIGGVEVMKANTADKDADGLGGNVNLILKEAASGMKLNADLQTGYSGQSREMGAYKGSLFFSNRFLKEKLGFLVSVNAESYDRSSDQWENSFSVQGDPAPDDKYKMPYITESTLKSRIENRKRYNASIFLDFKTQNSLIKTSSFYSGLGRSYFDSEKAYNLESNLVNFQHNDVEQKGYIFSNAIEGKHTLFNTSLDWGLGISNSLQEQPYNHELEFRLQSAYIVNPGSINTLEPQNVASGTYVNENIDDFYLYDGTFVTNKSTEFEKNAWINWEIPINITSDIRLSFKTGAKFRGKERMKDSKNYNDRFDNSANTEFALSAMPDIVRSSHLGFIGLGSFINNSNNSTSQDFMNERFANLKLNYILDRDKIRTFYDKVGSQEGIYQYIATGHIKNDYNGNEKVFATYAMCKLQFGKMITFSPGVRYERSFMEYTGYSGDAIPDDDLSQILNIEATEVTTDTTIHNILPQIHLKIKPFEWLDVRLAYTNTISRPDFNDLAPRKQISASSRSVKYSGTYLDNLRSRNYDVIVSLYSPKLGFLTFGAFHKEIEGFIYWKKAQLLSNTDMDPKYFNLPASYSGYVISYPLNNPDNATINGFEVEIQTNLSTLPSPFNGLVLSGNFTLMDSKTWYRATDIISTYNPITHQIETTYNEIKYDDRMLQQAKYLANLSIGYDYKGFSARASYSFTDQILTKEQRRSDAADKEITLPFSKWDVQVKQKITKNLSIYGNIANAFNEPDERIRFVTGYYSQIENYGLAINFGLKYKFF